MAQQTIAINPKKSHAIQGCHQGHFMLKSYPMKTLLKCLSIPPLILFVSGLGYYFFCPKPLLLQGISYSSAVYDQQGHLLRLTLSQDEKYRLFTPLKAISPKLIEATLLQEDRYFYRHPGINPLAMFKAAWQTWIVRSRRMGASTISMQVARLRYGLHSKRLSGKLRQMLLAIQLERHYRKDEILEAYLNLAPYGHNIEGVGAASAVLFHRTAQQLSLTEALSLAVLPQNPRQRPKAANKLLAARQRLFHAWLTSHPEDQREAAQLALPLHLYKPADLPFLAPHFSQQVLQEAPAGQPIYTSLQGDWQRLFARLVHQYLQKKQALGIDNAAVVLVDSRSNQILVELGSANFQDKNIAGQINGSLIKRSPGSTLKPFIYALALDQGLIHPATVLKDVPQHFGSYSPDNFDYQFVGPVSATEALILSRNIPAVDLAQRIQHPDLHQLLVETEVSQLRPPSYYGLALALGGVEISLQEMASLYAMLARQGLWQQLTWEKAPSNRPQKPLLSPEAAFLVLDMLQQTSPPLGSSTLEYPIAYKTGTSSGYRDAWAAGVSGPYVLIVWLGHFDGHSNQALVGKDLAAPLLFQLMQALQAEVKPWPQAQPDPSQLNLTRIDVCAASGLLPTPFCQSLKKTWFIPGKSPIQHDNIYREVAINPRTGLRTCHIDDQTDFAIYEFWPSDLLRLFKQAGIQRRIAPGFEPGCPLSSSQSLSPQISSPRAGTRYVINHQTSRLAEIPLLAVSDGEVKTLYWFVNNQFLGKSARNQPWLWKTAAGSYTIRVVDDHGQTASRKVKIQIE